jgi:hypothetical protein
MKVFINDAIVGTARLRYDVAPRSARAIWDVLPIRARLMHATSSGESVFFPLDIALDIDLTDDAKGASGVTPEGVVVHNERLIIPENETCFVSQGDFVITPYKACIAAYGRRAIIRSYVGDLPSNAFAYMRDPDELDEFERVAKQTLAHGAKTIELRR